MKLLQEDIPVYSIDDETPDWVYYWLFCFAKNYEFISYVELPDADYADNVWYKRLVEYLNSVGIDTTKPFIVWNDHYAKMTPYQKRKWRKLRLE